MPTNPYCPPSAGATSARQEGRWGPALWSLAMTFGVSMATLSLFASAAWDGTVTVRNLRDLSHIHTAMISLGLAMASGLCLYASFTLSSPHLRVTLLAVLGLIAVGLLFFADWPVAVYYVYFDMANLLAIYVAIGLVPSLLIALFPPCSRKYWHAVIPYIILAMMAVYVTVRSS